MPDARNPQGFAVVERREVELELGVLDGIRREHVRAERCHAPLDALAEIPHLALARAPCRQVACQPVARVGEQAAAEKLAGATVARVTVGARVVALAHPLRERRAPARDRRARLGAPRVARWAPPG